MGRRNIRLDDDAFELLRAMKRPNDTWDALIVRLCTEEAPPSLILPCHMAAAVPKTVHGSVRQEWEATTLAEALAKQPERRQKFVNLSDRDVRRRLERAWRPRVPSQT